MKTEKLSSEKVIFLVTIISNTVFFLMHVLYTIIFVSSKAYLMAYINFFSSIFYLFLFLLLIKNKYEMYALICGIEITAYMTTGTIICGSLPGFHLCLIGMCTLAFVTKYFLQNKKLVVNPLIVSSIFLIIYIFLYFYNKYNNPIIELPEFYNTLLYIIHSLVVFIFIVGFLVVLIDYVFRLEKNITKISETDNLTQTVNRNGLHKYFEGLEDQKTNYLAAIFDIDDFKVVNDKYGHLCGDYVLKQIADIAKENSLDDLVSRWGGEEFVIISKIENSIEETIQKIDNIRIKIDNFKFKYNNKKIHSTITIGVAKYENEETLDEWITKADKNLYTGKNSGKNKLIF